MSFEEVLGFVRSLNIGHQAYLDVDVGFIAAGARGNVTLNNQSGLAGYEAAIFHTIMFDRVPPNVLEFAIAGNDFSRTSILISTEIIGKLIPIWAYSTQAAPINIEVANNDPIAAHAFRMTVGLFRFRRERDMEVVRGTLAAAGLGLALKDVASAELHKDALDHARTRW